VLQGQKPAVTAGRAESKVTLFRGVPRLVPSSLVLLTNLFIFDILSKVLHQGIFLLYSHTSYSIQLLMPYCEELENVIQM